MYPKPRLAPKAPPISSNDKDIRPKNYDPELYYKQPYNDISSGPWNWDTSEEADGYEYSDGFWTSHCPGTGWRTEPYYPGDEGAPRPKDSLPPGRENRVACDVSWRFVFDKFEIRGKDWPEWRLGVRGEGLKRQVGGCGQLTYWNWFVTPDNCCFDWYAEGKLPVGVRACVGRAVEAAGGSSKGNCHGAG